MKRSQVLIAVLVLVVVAAAVVWFVVQSRSQQTVAIGGSGLIEVTEVPVAPATSGQLLTLPAAEGQQAKQGQVLATVDGRVLAHQADAAKAQVDAAQAGVRGSQANVAAAQANVAAARAGLRGARDGGDRAAIRTARAQVKQAQAQVKVAQAQVKQAQALVSQTKAQLGVAKTQLSQAAVFSPLDGVVLTVPANAGEQVSAGQTILTIGDLSHPRLVIYVPEPQMGQVKLGEKASVTVDGLPGRTFSGTVSQVAEQAEFTPTNIQTKDQRSKLVFAVTISLPNSDLSLKPGMPADAALD